MWICNLLLKKRFTDVHSPSWILHISDSLGTPTSKQYMNVKERSLQSGVNLVPSFTCVRTPSRIFGRGKARKGLERECSLRMIYMMIYLTNRFQFAVRLFNKRSQMTSKCGKNKKWHTRRSHNSVSLFLPHKIKRN